MSFLTPTLDSADPLCALEINTSICTHVEVVDQDTASGSQYADKLHSPIMESRN